MPWHAQTRVQLMSCSRLPQPHVTEDFEPVALDRSSGCTPSSGTYPIHHRVAEPDRFEHPDKAGHPRATPIGSRSRNTPNEITSPPAPIQPCRPVGVAIAL